MKTLNLNLDAISEICNKLDDEYLMHYGTPRHSGRYPWGSGEHPFQSGRDFLAYIDEYKKLGYSKTEIAKLLGMSTTDFRNQEAVANSERRADVIDSIKSLKSDGFNNVQIAAKLGLKGESTVRSLLNEEAEVRMNLAIKTADNLAKLVEEKGFIDVGKGAEISLNIKETKMNNALQILEFQGYELYSLRIPQQTNPGKWTTIKVLCPPGTTYAEAYNASKSNKVQTIEDYTTRDNGNTLEPSFRYPASMSSKRLAIRYAEEGGLEKDGLVEIRRGVKDLSLGDSNYSQVRILVDGTHYIKGMAVYSDNVPEGYDLIFNTNKHVGTPVTSDNPDAKTVLKPIKKGDTNPFGSSIKEKGGQSYYDDPNGEFTDPITGKKQSLSLINKRADEGDWKEWSKTLPSQFLSKQPVESIKNQIGLATAQTKEEYDEIMSLTNPNVKRNLLKSFADECDAAAVELKAAAYPNQRYQVIMPVPSMKDGEAFAPLYENGTKLALIRYPHGGIFEIPIVTVNNNNPEAKSQLTLGAKDVVGINARTASQLSGADFDGDTVMVIPQSKTVVTKNKAPLQGLKDFDPDTLYGCTPKEVNGEIKWYRGDREVPQMKHATTQTQMGIISNLITDMTLKGAPDDELERAVRHSMVIIDAEKHHYDYRASERAEGIKSLQQKWQAHANKDGELTGGFGGAGSLISRAGAEINIPERKEGEFRVIGSEKTVTLINPNAKQKDQMFKDNNTGEIFNKSQVHTVYIDPKTGEKLYHETGRTINQIKIKTETGTQTYDYLVKDNEYFYKKKNTSTGKNDYIKFEPDDPNIKILAPKLATVKASRMSLVSDAYDLSTGNVKENIYAEYANTMKALANTARKEMLTIENIPWSASAKEIYKDEIKSLENKLTLFESNKPKERQAQMITALNVELIRKENPNMTSEQLGKLKQRELSKNRIKVGAAREAIVITNKEWEAIQAGAVSPTKLDKILQGADSKVVRQLATPKKSSTLSTSKINQLKSFYKSGYSIAEIAKQLGISTSTVLYYIEGKDQE